MKMLLGFLLACGLVGCQNPSSDTTKSTPPLVSSTPITKRPSAQWTLVFYLAGDNDLEESLREDLEQLSGLAWNEQVRALVLFDRSPLGANNLGYSNEAVANLANWSGAKLIEVQPDRLVEVADWGEVNCADPATLKSLLSLARDRFPAQHYALILADHGHAWQGICNDNSAASPQDRLDLQELPNSLSGSLDLMVLDACAMASLEMYLECAPHCQWLLASQESLPGSGLDYEGALEPLLRQPKMDGKELGMSFLKSFEKSLADQPGELMQAQLSLLHCAPHQALKLALGQWAGQNKQSAPELALARSHSEVLPELCDLGQLTQGGLQPALQKVVTAQVRGAFRRQRSGLSVYFPALGGPVTEYPPGAWSKFLSQYAKQQSALQGNSPLSKVSLSSRDGQLELRAALLRPQDVHRSYTILVQDNRVVGQLTCVPQGKLLADFYAGHWLSLREKGSQGHLLAQLNRAEQAEDQLLVSLECQLRTPNTPPQAIELRFALRQGQPGHLVACLRNGVACKLQPGDQIAFLERDLRPGGHAKPGPWLELEHPDQLELLELPVPKGNYDLGFLISDGQARNYWQTQPLLLQGGDAL
jgi:hypothetical protein